MSYMATGFARVDQGGDAEYYADCLRFLSSLDYFKRYKRASFDLLRLREGAVVLDLGCGLGDDAAAIAERVGAGGRVFAVDASHEMIRRARAVPGRQGLPIEFLVADVRELPFEDGLIDACRIDRTLQHIQDPARALAEMTRVLRPGGRLVAMDPDWETLTVDSERRETTRRMLNFWCDSFPSGWAGRRLYRYFRSTGRRLPKNLAHEERLM